MKIPLSAMDYYFFRPSLYTIQFVFEYPGKLKIENLTKALCLTAQAVPAIASRIKVISKNEIVLETGFSLTPEECSLDNEPTDPLHAEDFLVPIENKEGSPLVKILVSYSPTRTFVGFSFSHLLGDGASFFKFLRILSRICLSQEVSEKVSNERHLLQLDPNNSEGSTSLFNSTGYVIPCPTYSPDFKIERMRFSYLELERQKMSFKDRGIIISTNDILMAELAKRFHRDIPLHEGQFIVRCPVDYRKIYEVSQDYFGNAVRDAIAIFEPEEVEQMTLAEVALRIRQSILDVDKSSVLKSLKALDQLRRTEGIEIFKNICCPGLLVSNLSKFPIAQIDLGLGAPTGFHHGSLAPRLGLILPNREGVEVSFKRPLSQNLQIINHDEKMNHDTPARLDFRN